MLDQIRKVLKQSSLVSQFLSRVESENDLKISGLAGSASALLISELFTEMKKTILIVTPTDKMASEMAGDLRECCSENSVCHFPSWGISPYNFLPPAQENISQRIETIWKLAHGEPLLVVTSPEALIEPTLFKGEIAQCCIDLKLDIEFDLDQIVHRLAQMGYERGPVTEEEGTFSIRGGILDIFPFNSTNPVRCEFFGDLIESMRYFSVLSQRSVEKVDAISIIPRREVLIPQQELERLADEQDDKSTNLIRDKCLGGFGYPGLEWIAPLFGVNRSTLFEYLPSDSRFYFSDLELIKAKLSSYEKDAREFYNAVVEIFPSVPKPKLVYLSEAEVVRQFKLRSRITEVPLGSSDGAINFGMKDHPTFNGQIKLLRENLKDHLSRNQSVFILSDSQLQSRRLSELLPESELQVQYLESEIRSGFIFPDVNLVTLTDHQIFKRHFVRQRRRRFKEGAAISSYNALNVGDYIVHVDYGIGRYRGLQEIKINNRRRECLLIKYQNDAKLYVPIEEFGRVQKYIGKEGKPPLTRLGGKSWEKVKARTKKAIADMAEELIRLYAARKAKPGFAFTGEDDWMRQLEASFPYQETDDQLVSIEAIKKDMENSSPMDRLVCGDVGFGKTEVAIRAALKAVSSGKQVAVLVPTTILALQHMSTFRERLSQLPAKIEMLSRFRSRAQQKEIIAELGEGKVDIIIGTHRLLQKDLKIPNLGLIVIDEEQRFGVAHKEKLKKLRETVDSLALSATPIPRTLHMSLLGVRDMSQINSSPKDRLPIITEITEFDPKIIYEAITEEITRNGQVYFVHNRVQTILSMHSYLSKLMKTIRIAVAHGQMPEKKLEEVMLSFLNKEYDVLLSTSIIESGIDIPSVNTIIINRADRFGLAQLYQLRGRVGRSQHRAFAYLLVPPVRLLTDTARKRLKAIEQHTELGSGFHLAMKDLEIRGAGNLLGPQQHGFVEEVGFDLYCQLLDEAVAELKGEAPPAKMDVRLEFDCDIDIPTEYIEDSTQRVEIYRKISDAKSSSELDLIVEELEDRFGKYGEQVQNLLDFSHIKLLAAAKSITRIRLKNNKLQIFYSNQRLPAKKEIERFRSKAPEQVEFDASSGFIITVSFPKKQNNIVRETKKLLQTL